MRRRKLPKSRPTSVRGIAKQDNGLGTWKETRYVPGGKQTMQIGDAGITKIAISTISFPPLRQRSQGGGIEKVGLFGTGGGGDGGLLEIVVKGGSTASMPANNKAGWVHRGFGITFIVYKGLGVYF